MKRNVEPLALVIRHSPCVFLAENGMYLASPVVSQLTDVQITELTEREADIFNSLRNIRALVCVGYLRQGWNLTLSLIGCSVSSSLVSLCLIAYARSC